MRPLCLFFLFFCSAGIPNIGFSQEEAPTQQVSESQTEDPVPSVPAEPQPFPSDETPQKPVSPPTDTPRIVPPPVGDDETPVQAAPPPKKKRQKAVVRKTKVVPVPEKRWYFDIAPGYFYFTDPNMRRFYDNGGVTFRGETGYRFWGPLTVWIDGSYFQKQGHDFEGLDKTDIKIATITLGFKTIFYLHDRIAFYTGAGPRLFMMLLHNDYEFIRSDDNQVGIGGGFDAGFWFFPIPQWRDFFLNVCVDYSWKKMKVDEDEISSFDNDVDISGLTFALGLGLRF